MTTNIVDKDGNSIAASDATVPSDRLFRNAWSLSGSTITEDVATARNLLKEKIREVRSPLLAAEDVVYMKALEDANTSAQAASIRKKKALRDAPGTTAIANAATITALKNAWNTAILGDSPYA